MAQGGAHSACGAGPSYSLERPIRERNRHRLPLRDGPSQHCSHWPVLFQRCRVLQGPKERSCVQRSPRHHSHHSDEVHFECKIFHGGTNSPHPNTAVAHLVPWSHEPVSRFRWLRPLGTGTPRAELFGCVRPRSSPPGSPTHGRGRPWCLGRSGAFPWLPIEGSRSRR